MGAYDALIKQLQETRAGLAKELAELPAKLQAEKRKATSEELKAFDEKEAEAKELDGQIKRFQAQDERETRAAEARVATGDAGKEERGDAGGSRAVVTSEPTVYGRGSGHSYFLDMARAEMRRGDGDGGVSAAVDRQRRHAAEIDKLMPERRAAVERRARRAYEERFASTPAEQRALARMDRMGISPFEKEKRFISRTDGAGGYFVPPLWLIDDFIPYLRAGRVFADQWMNMPLPSGTDSINIPRVVLGTATGPQAADGGPVPGRDVQDNFVNALVRTVAGQQDAAIQLLDQSPVAFDQIIFKDLMADYAMQLSGQLIVGSGTNGQLTGVFPNGIITGGTTKGFHIDTVTNATAATIWVGASTSFYTGVSQLLSNIARKRFRPPTGLVTNPAVWYALAGSYDTTNRPIVMPQQQGLGYNAAAGDDDGPETQGPIGHILGVPWIVDPNVPLTFGGTVAPSIGIISQGNVAPVDGTGGNNVFTPAVAAVWDDLYLWEGEMRSRTLSEVLSGTLQVRFQVYSYVADMPNRFQDSSGNYLSYGNANSASTTGAALSTSGGLSGF